MVKNFNHQKTIGVIGAIPDAQAFILKANQLGFETYLLCKNPKETGFIYGADKIFVGSLEDEQIHEHFLMHCDLIVYYDETLNATEIEEIQQTVIVPQGDDLLSIAQDRVLQKAFLESLTVNIAPYVTVVKPEDIKAGLRSIGYPAVLRTNQVNPESKEQSFFIYEESDIDQATALLKYGTCVLESWIVSEHELSVSAVKAGNGEIILFPTVKKEYKNDRLHNIQVPAEIDQELSDEINRVTQVILEGIQFRGLATIDFIVTPANALYIGNIYPYPNILSRFSEAFCSMSATEAHLRAITSLPLPETFSHLTPYVYAPFYADEKELIDELLTIQPDWKFTFYPITSTSEMNAEEAVGHMLIETEDVKKTLTKIKRDH